MAENPGGDCQGVGGEVQLPRGTDTPGVKTLSQGEETSGGTLEGDGVPGEDGRGRGGDENYPFIQDTKGSVNTSRREDMASGKEPVAPQIPQRGILGGEIGEVSTQGHPDGANAAKPKLSTLARREYGLLAPTGPAVDPADAKDPGIVAGHGATREQEGREPE